ncbi:MAG: thiamine pyrophosphate-binding protein [Candidatus Eisenbacteria bacterium]|nr:thiamine pyrophosphate-binding protein [Candidatus Eisenbacteria bacterium]
MATVVELISTMLKREGVQYIFGIPGGGGTIDLLSAAEKDGIRFVLNTHETAAAMMACVVGELTGTPGVVVTAISPGITNIANGVAYAYLDRSPLLVLSDNYPWAATQVLLRQVLNSRQLFQGITKWTASLSAEWAHETLQRAFRTMLEERPGPVQLDLPDDVTMKQVADKLFPLVSKQVMARLYSEEPAGFSQVVGRIREAKAPVIIAGMGVRWDSAYLELRALAERIGAPVFCTPKAKGALPENHPYSAGVFIGGKLEMDILGKADLIIGVGLDPADMLAKPWKYSQPIIAIDRVTNYNEIYHAEMELVGNIAEILTMLSGSLPAEHKWDERVAPAYRKKVYDALALPAQGLALFRVSDITREITSEDVILTMDVGASKLLLSQIWRPYQPNSVLMSNPLGTMGFGVPSAIAAKLTFPIRQVVSLCGDGGFSMRMAELQTAMQLGVAPVIVVLSDQALSQIRIKQVKKGLAVVGTEFRAPDYIKIAEAFGGRGISVGTEAEYSDALKEALGSNRFTLIQARIDPSQYAAQFDAIREL